MAQGFKDSSGKFHPTGNNGTSSRQKTLTPSGLRLRRNIKSAPEGQDIAPYSEARVVGNEVIDKVVEAFKELHPKYDDWKIHNTDLYNDYDNIQKTFYYSKDNVEKLLEWRRDPSPDTWKWLIPLHLENPNNQADVIAGEDDHNMGFLEDAFKGKVSIVLLSPRDYLRLACPNCLQMFDKVGFEGLDFDARGKEFTKENIDKFAQRLKEGKTIDTIFLHADLDDMEITSHEGRHRAFGALKAGLEQIPVYIYNDEMNDQQREEITNNPTGLTPDLRK